MNRADRRTPDSADFAAYLRELPKLLKAGEDGRVALIHGGRLVSVWDTPGDALQAGHDRFGLDAEFLTQPISRKDLVATPRARRTARRPTPKPARP
jgi:hypothetical protein